MLSANDTSTGIYRVLIDVQVSVLRGRSHAPLQRLTVINWGICFFGLRLLVRLEQLQYEASKLLLEVLHLKKTVRFKKKTRLTF